MLGGVEVLLGDEHAVREQLGVDRLAILLRDQHGCKVCERGGGVDVEFGDKT